MGLLDKLSLTPPNRNNAARRSAVRRARLAARLSRSEDRREILESAVDMATSLSRGPLRLGRGVEDPGNPQTPIAKMAPRGAYQDIPQGTGEDRLVGGRIETHRGIGVARVQDSNGKWRTDFDAKTTVTKRELVPQNLGKGERVYDKGNEKRLRQPTGMNTPESLVMGHEHLHLTIAAHITSRIEEFADNAFRDTQLSSPAAEELAELLEDIALEAEDRVQEWLDDIATPHDPAQIPRVDETIKRLLSDGTIERRARTALLNVIRKHSRELAKFR